MRGGQTEKGRIHFDRFEIEVERKSGEEVEYHATDQVVLDDGCQDIQVASYRQTQRSCFTQSRNIYGYSCGRTGINSTSGPVVDYFTVSDCRDTNFVASHFIIV